MKITSKYGFIKEYNNEIQVISDNLKVIQVEQVADRLFVECVTIDDWLKIKLDTNTDSSKDIDEFRDACETELKSDPFSNGYHNGERLIDIRNEDLEWWTTALSKFKNKFILEKMQIIEKGIRNGKVYN